MYGIKLAIAFALWVFVILDFINIIGMKSPFQLSLEEINSLVLDAALAYTGALIAFQWD